jgi:monoamine oxidase
MPGYDFPPFPTKPMAPKPGPPQRVAVLGAGLSGLCAADLLTQAGHDVILLEAADRAGGRVHTLRDGFSEGLHADAGAAFVMGGHTLTAGYCAQFGLELLPVPVTPGVEVDYLNGTRLLNTGGGNTTWPVALLPSEQGKTIFALMEQYLTPVFQELMGFDPRDPAWPQPPIAQFDAVTFAGLLASKGASPGVVSLLRLGFADFWGDGVSATSAMLILRDDAFMAALSQTPGDPPQAHPASRRFRHYAAVARMKDPRSMQPLTPLGVYRIRRGTDQLTRAFAGRLGARIRFGTPVVAIRQNDRGVEVDCGNGGGMIQADRVISTIPCSVLRDIAISPALPEPKAAAIRDLPYTSVTRVFLEFNTRYWQAQGCIGTASTDLPVTSAPERQGMWTEDATATQTTPRGILDCYFTGAPARLVGAMAPPERARFALEQVELVFPGAREHYSGNAVSKCWDEDPWARGDYCWFTPGQMQQVYPQLARPEGRIHFAGDHTSALPGWMQGALESGFRTAGEVNSAG